MFFSFKRLLKCLNIHVASQTAAEERKTTLPLVSGFTLCLGSFFPDFVPPDEDDLLHNYLWSTDSGSLVFISSSASILMRDHVVLRALSLLGGWRLPGNETHLCTDCAWDSFLLQQFKFRTEWSETIEWTRYALLPQSLSRNRNEVPN